MTLTHEVLARSWCQVLALSLPCQHIERDGRPYLERYFVAGWSPSNRQSGPALFLHHFVASDASYQVHSHPWGWSCSLILAGGYKEDRCTGDGETVTRYYRYGDVNVIQATDKHRIDLIEADCWTLFLAGNVEQSWSFSVTC